MDKKEHKAYIKEIQEYTSKVLRSEEDTRAFFKSVGIHTKSGKLSSRYSNTSPKTSTKVVAK